MWNFCMQFKIQNLKLFSTEVNIIFYSFIEFNMLKFATMYFNFNIFSVGNIYTHPEPPNWLQRSHTIQYQCG